MAFELCEQKLKEVWLSSGGTWIYMKWVIGKQARLWLLALIFFVCFIDDFTQGSPLFWGISENISVQLI